MNQNISIYNLYGNYIKAQTTTTPVINNVSYVHTPTAKHTLSFVHPHIYKH